MRDVIIKYAIVQPTSDGTKPVVYFKKFGKNGVAKFVNTSKWANCMIDESNVAIYEQRSEAEKVISKLKAVLPHREFEIKEME